MTRHVHISENNAQSADWLQYALPPAVDYVEENSNVYFKDDNGDVSAVIPLTTNVIAAEQFRGAPITQIHLPTKITTIAECAFRDAKLTSITVPSTVTSIGESAFRNNTSLTSIQWSTSNRIPDYCFAYCSGLTTSDDIIFDGNVTKMGAYAFEYCGFTHFKYPDSISTIGNYTLYNSLNLLSIDFNNVGRIAYGSCFYGNKLKYITIGANATIVQYCVTSSAEDKEITVKATTPPSLSSSTAFGTISKIAAIYVPPQSVDAYKAASNWAALADKIQAML